MSRLRTTTLVLAMCSFQDNNWAIEIEAPRLRSFTYKGCARSFLLTTPDLHFLTDSDFGRTRERDEGATRILFWQFLKNFSNAKVLRIKVNSLKQIAAIGKVCLFPGVERLELEGVYDPASNKDAVAIGNLLRCCPALRDLRLKLSTTECHSDKSSEYARPFLERKDRLDYDKSLDHFTHRRSSKPMVSTNDQCDQVFDIPGLRGRSFTCLQRSLRRVGLQFRLDGANCFGVRLIKFFADNAMLLQELSVDSGNRRLVRYCKVDICGEEVSSEDDLIKLTHLLQLFANAQHLHLESARLGSGLNNDELMRSFPSLRHLELRGRLPDDDTSVVAAVSRILEHTPNLEALSMAFHPEEYNRWSNDRRYYCAKEGELLDAHHLSYNPHSTLVVPSASIPSLRSRVREINLVHYQGGRAQRTLAKFLLSNALVMEELWCNLAEGPLRTQAQLMREIKD
ncbi:hypothetical protein PR202_gb00946 [Eleusine coracana subsp. coracana]|uniref:FBD domain-containing protein n=1 Tax=Eleusine coracana subsp. coracana TaxID=191504 RepID=A0AAV5DT53_ELECO|nr:hypothetical protein PR202_gb00946 [Eleusine coracana subsp. coracana]